MALHNANDADDEEEDEEDELNLINCGAHQVVSVHHLDAIVEEENTMSDVSILSQEYETSAQLSRKINRVAIYLKKKQLGLASASQEATAALRDAHYLVGVLNALCQRLDPEFLSNGTVASALNIPRSLVERLQNQHCGDVTDYLEDLTRIAHRLNADAIELDEVELTLLDQLASIADAETSSVFRRLMRK